MFSLEKGIVPLEWNVANITPLFKKGFYLGEEGPLQSPSHPPYSKAFAGYVLCDPPQYPVWL